MSAEWAFRRDADGRWYWVCIDEGSISESAHTFDNQQGCVADAVSHGYDGQGQSCHAEASGDPRYWD
jgi:phosphoribosylaminoimidazole carboxylase (NCAIR synthetase)